MNFKKLARSRDKHMVAVVRSKYSLLMDSCKHFRSKVNNLNQHLKRGYFSTKIMSINVDVKETLRVLSQLINKCSKTININLLAFEDQSITHKFYISNVMNDYFCSVGKSLNKMIPFNPNPLLPNTYRVKCSKPMFKFKTIDIRQIERAVSKMKTSLNSGHDEISSYIPKPSLPVISSSLCYIFNYSLLSGSFLDYWTTARVSPIFKE